MPELVPGAKGTKNKKKTMTKDNNKELENNKRAEAPENQAAGNAVEPAEATPSARTGGERQKSKGPRKPFFKKRDGAASEFIEKVIAINRVTKVTKGGKRLAFSALVVVGDSKGRVGYGLEKAGEVATAIKKSLTHAKRAMIRVSLYESTIPHQIIGSCGAAQVLLKPASEGTGVIAAGPVRAICDSVGIRNILTKCHRSNNPINVVKATIDGLQRLKPRKAENILKTTATEVSQNAAA